MPIRLRGGRHYAWGATFEKVDETIAQASANNTPTNQNLKHKKPPDYLGGFCVIDYSSSRFAILVATMSSAVLFLPPFMMMSAYFFVGST